ncbi:hypothetical protein B0H21DRAFT_785725 [Amylocystis lapponica]|nr:hypothetical protein B0H21DRAFT_785725 [Amylocystis lapponica]
MILGPSTAPPLPSAPATPPSTTGNVRVSTATTQATVPDSTTRSAVKSAERSLSHLTIPTVQLDTERITHTMAATLALSLLGHVLFLKSQVPFPVLQLARMPGAQSDSRAGRRREDLLSAIDTLTSHLHTSFSALSTALALRSAKGKGSADTARAQLAFVLGPSVGAARARVMFIVDGLEVKHWGERTDGLGMSKNTPRVGNGENFDQDDDDEDEGSGEEEDGETEEDESEDDFASEDESDASDGQSDAYETSSEPPASRSPSPSPPSSDGPSRTHSPVLRPSPIKVHTELASSPTTPPLPPQQTYAEEQSALRAAERLLSRTLASACAEEGGGMSCELAPTQTHVLLRAPRRFAHPAWLPRQNMTRALEGVLQSFMEDAGATDAPPNEKGHARTRGVRTEGVWVGCAGAKVDEVEQVDGSESGEEDEEDEMIWWIWNGKIAGFSDW